MQKFLWLLGTSIWGGYVLGVTDGVIGYHNAPDITDAVRYTHQILNMIYGGLIWQMINQF